MIYIASPYTAPTYNIMDHRFKCIQLATSVLQVVFLEQRFFSPIMYWHETAKKFKLPVHVHFWEEWNSHILSLCESMSIVTLRGWRESVGINKEQSLAQHLNIPIGHINFKKLIMDHKEVVKCLINGNGNYQTDGCKATGTI
jgi:hypothetical protein